MSFQDKYTTEEIKNKIKLDKDIPQEKKDQEEKKSIVSNDAYLQAEVTENLISEIKSLRLFFR